MNDISLEENIASVVSHPAGPGIDFFMVLGIDRLEDGRYRVWTNLESVVDGEEIFDSPRDAVRRLLDLRHHHKIGFDYEVG